MFGTQNDLPLTTRTQVVKLLNERLAGLLEAHLHAKR